MGNTTTTPTDVAFDSPDLRERLDAWWSSPERYDDLPFGLVAMELDGTVVAYNRLEARFAGLAPEKALGLCFFIDIAPCTNNYLVSGRYDEESVLDTTIDYVFTVKMRPTAVRLRLLKNEDAQRQYLAVAW